MALPRPSMSREDMLAAFERGESIVLNGIHYVHPSQLPAEEEFAAGDPSAEERLREDLVLQRAALDARIERLGMASMQAPTEEETAAAEQARTGGKSAKKDSSGEAGEQTAGA